MSNTNSPRTGRPAFGRKGLIIGAAAIGFAIGGYTLASAAQGAFFDDSPAPADVTVPGTDDTVAETTENTVSSSTDDTTGSTVDDNGGDNGGDDSDDDGTSTTIDDHGNDDDDDNSTTTVNGMPLPDPFTETYSSAGGSITVSWTGTKFVIDSIDAAPGYTAEIKDQRWDRVRVEFEGSGDDSRIEVRISDDDNSVRIDID